MKYRFSLIALVSAVSLPALATSGITPVPGEAGFTTHAMPSAKSRADVIKELEAWKRNPVTADGWREVGGERAGSSSGRTTRKTRASSSQATTGVALGRRAADVGGEAGAVTSASGTARAMPPRASSLGGLSRSGHQSGATATSHVTSLMHRRAGGRHRGRRGQISSVAPPPIVGLSDSPPMKRRLVRASRSRL
jgi:hypothetical protein